MFGGWTCRGCGSELDRVGRPLEDYPHPGPAWFLTQTVSGAAVFVLAGLFLFALAAASAYFAVSMSPSWWLAFIVFVLIGLPSIVAGGMALYAHLRWPPTRPAAAP